MFIARGEAPGMRQLQGFGGAFCIRLKSFGPPAAFAYLRLKKRGGVHEEVILQTVGNVFMITLIQFMYLFPQFDRDGISYCVVKSFGL